MQRKMKGLPSIYAQIDFSNIHNIEMLIYPETQETSCLAKKAWSLSCNTNKTTQTRSNGSSGLLICKWPPIPKSCWWLQKLIGKAFLMCRLQKQIYKPQLGKDLLTIMIYKKSNAKSCCWQQKLSRKSQLEATLMCQKTGACHSKCETKCLKRAKKRIQE